MMEFGFSDTRVRDGLWFTSPADELRSKLSSSQTVFRPERAGEGLWPFVSRNLSQICASFTVSLGFSRSTHGESFLSFISGR